MRRFTTLSRATVAATLLLIALGGFVRAMEAGLGCPDWPTCHGSLNPPSSLAAGPLKLAWIEHSHRIVAAVVIALIVAVAVAAFRTGQPRRVQVVSLVMVPAVLSQAVIGAFVVWWKLDAASVVLHLSGALIVLALAVFVSLGGAVRPAPLPAVTAGVTVVQMLLGSAVTGWAAGLAYGTFPSFNGQVLPPQVTSPQQWLHVTHRLLAFVVAGLVVALWWRLRTRASALAVGLVGVQILLGALNIWFRLPAWSVTPHLAVGSWLVTVLLVVTYRTRSVPAARRALQVATA